MANLLHQEQLQNSETMRVVSYRGTFVTIEDDNIRLALLACRDAESSLHQHDLSDSEGILSCFASAFDAYDHCLRLLSIEKDKCAKSTNSGRLRDVQFLFTLEKFCKQRRSVERNVYLLKEVIGEMKAGKQVNVNNVIALWELVGSVRNRVSNVIEDLEELNELSLNLPEGVTEEQKQSSETLGNTIDSLHLQYRAIRAYYAAER